MRRGVTPGVQVAAGFATALILGALLFGLKPVTRTGEVYAPGEYACGSAWYPLYTDLATSFDESCWDAGISRNLTISIVLGALGLTVGIAAFSAAGSASAVTAATAAAQARRPCRHCAEDIKPAAKVCPYCGRDVRAATAARRVAPAMRPLTLAPEPDYVVQLP